MGEQRADEADARTRLAEDRTVLANERTYSAWVRTGLAALATGMAFERFLIGTLPHWRALSDQIALVPKVPMAPTFTQLVDATRLALPSGSA
jgi:uncharacterized membrane protein YidH (DUF202 family)